MVEKIGNKLIGIRINLKSINVFSQQQQPKNTRNAVIFCSFGELVKIFLMVANFPSMIFFSFQLAKSMLASDKNLKVKIYDNLIFFSSTMIFSVVKP